MASRRKSKRKVRRLSKQVKALEHRQARQMLRLKHDVIHAVQHLLEEYSADETVEEGL